VLAELLETEVRYGRDLRVLQDELYKPLLVAGLVPLRQLGKNIRREERQTTTAAATTTKKIKVKMKKYKIRNWIIKGDQRQTIRRRERVAN
jgi:hypothetical protein